MKEDIILNNIPTDITPIFLPPIKYKYIDGTLHIYCHLNVLNEVRNLRIVNINGNHKDSERYVSINEIEEAIRNNPLSFNTISYHISTIRGKLKQDYYQKFKCYYNELTEEGFYHIGGMYLSLEQLKSLETITAYTTVNCHIETTGYRHLYPNKKLISLTMKYRILFKDETEI